MRPLGGLHWKRPSLLYAACLLLAYIISVIDALKELDPSESRCTDRRKLNLARAIYVAVILLYLGNVNE